MSLPFTRYSVFEPNQSLLTNTPPILWYLFHAKGLNVINCHSFTSNCSLYNPQQGCNDTTFSRSYNPYHDTWVIIRYVSRYLKLTYRFVYHKRKYRDASVHRWIVTPLLITAHVVIALKLQFHIRIDTFVYRTLKNSNSESKIARYTIGALQLPTGTCSRPFVINNFNPTINVRY